MYDGVWLRVVDEWWCMADSNWCQYRELFCGLFTLSHSQRLSTDILSYRHTDKHKERHIKRHSPNIYSHTDHTYGQNIGRRIYPPASKYMCICCRYFSRIIQSSERDAERGGLKLLVFTQVWRSLSPNLSTHLLDKGSEPTGKNPSMCLAKLIRGF